MSEHEIRSMSEYISNVQDVPPKVSELAAFLPSDTPYRPRGETEIAPLFSLEERSANDTLDMTHPNVVEQLNQARLQAIREVQELNSRELKALSDSYAESFRKLHTAIASVEKVVASEVVDLALVVAQELVYCEMRKNPELIVQAVEDALGQVPHEGKVVVRLHAEDLTNVQERLEKDLQGTITLQWLADSSLSRGDCCVESPDRIIDASITTRLQVVRDSLVRVLMSEESQ